MEVISLFHSALHRPRNFDGFSGGGEARGTASDLHKATHNRHVLQISAVAFNRFSKS